MGNHIDVVSGKWTAQDAGIGAGVDSYFEYLLKGGILFGLPRLIDMFKGKNINILPDLAAVAPRFKLILFSDVKFSTYILPIIGAPLYIIFFFCYSIFPNFHSYNYYKL